MKTIAELEQVRDHDLIELLLSLARYRGFLIEYAKRGPEAERFAESDLFGVENGFNALRGEHRALLRPELFGQLEAAEHELRARVDRHPALKKKYGGAWDAIAGAVNARQALEPDLSWIEAPGAPRPPWARTSLMSWARALVRGADERLKPNEQRLEEYADARLPGTSPRAPIEGRRMQSGASATNRCVPVFVIRRLIIGRLPATRAKGDCSWQRQWRQSRPRRRAGPSRQISRGGSS